MKTIYNILLFCFALLFVSLGQTQAQDEDEEPNEQIKAMHIAFITQKLSLTEAQAQKFWPIFNNFFAEKQAIHKKVRRLNKLNPHTMSDEQIKNSLQEYQNAHLAEVEIDKKYQEKFLKVISLKQLLLLHQSEKEFKRMLLRELKERRNGR